jgi:hypothetical protein
MGGMTKREGAQRILDAHATRSKVKGRIVIGSIVIALLSLGVGWLSRWEFGLATLLACGLLFQYAIERMGTIVDASIANGLKAMGWSSDTELDEATLDKIRAVAQR